MNAIELDFEQAKARHLLFKSRLRAILYDSGIDDTAVLSHHECGLGKWIYDHALPAYGHLPSMVELERVHADIHTCARRLVRLYREGHTEQARAGLAEMEGIADRLTYLLDHLEGQLRHTAPAAEPGEAYISLSLPDFQELLRTNQEFDGRIKTQIAELSAALQHSKQELTTQQTLLQTVFDNADVALFLMDDQQQCVFMNPAAERLTGFRLDEVQGNNLHSFIHHHYPDGRAFPIEECPIDQALPERNRMQGEEMFVHPDGTFYPVSFTASPIMGAAGQPVGTVIEVRDLTEQKKTQAALLESEDVFRTITTVSPVGLFLTDDQGKITFANQTILDWLGMTKDVYLANGGAEAIVAEDLAPTAEAFGRSFAAQRPHTDEFRIHHADGTVHHCLLAAVPRYRDDGSFAGYVGSFSDITERKQAEDNLRQYYDDLEVKVTFRNLQLEQELHALRQQAARAGAGAPQASTEDPA